MRVHGGGGGDGFRHATMTTTESSERDGARVGGRLSERVGGSANGQDDAFPRPTSASAHVTAPATVGGSVEGSRRY